MAAAQIAPGAICTATAGLNIDHEALGYILSAVAIGIIGMTVLGSLFDARLASHLAQTLQSVEAANRVLEQKIRERDLAQAELRTSEQHFRVLIEQAGDGILIFSQQARYLDVNQRSLDLLGYSRDELVGADIDMVLDETERKEVAPELANILAGRDYKSEWLMRRKDGSTFPAEISAKLLSDGRVLVILREITERKLQENRIQRQSRVHAVLSGVNALIVRCRNRQELFKEICRIVVEKGHFRLAWVGLLQDGIVKPMAFHGNDNGILQSLRICPSEEGKNSDNSCGPTATALRQGKPEACNDIAQDPRMRNWHAAAAELGLGSFISLPLLLGGQAAGSFNLYAAEPGFFDDEEIKLLTELSANITYALEFIAKDEQLDYLEFYDPLTRLANRNQLTNRLAQYMLAASQARQRLALVKLDIDGFKPINDLVGRAGGDEVLKQCAARLVSLIGNASHVARTGADRFAIVVEDFKDNDILMRFVENELVPALGAPMTVAGHVLRPSIRVGIAVYEDDGNDPESLLRNAEAAVKKAKLGSERYLFYTQEMGVAGSEKLYLENLLRQAIDKNEFVLYYQPKVDLRSDSIVGAEALIRWNSPELGLVPPDRFIPMLEENGSDPARGALGDGAGHPRSPRMAGSRPAGAAGCRERVGRAAAPEGFRRSGAQRTGHAFWRSPLPGSGNHRVDADRRHRGAYRQVAGGARPWRADFD